MSNQLQKLFVPILEQSVCEIAFAHVLISSQMVCVGYLNGVSDACIGDSGGPLALDGKLFGIVSWGIGCAQVDYPGVYTYIPSVKDWILETVESMHNN